MFKQSAPVIKLPESATEDDHLGLVAVLNSSVACFWLKQVSHPKGGSGIDRGIQPEDWMERFEFTGTKLAEFPLPAGLPVAYGRTLDALAQRLAGTLPAAVLAHGAPTRAVLEAAHADYVSVRRRMIAVQEELDWDVYHRYGLTETPLAYGGELPEVGLGERAFEIVLARRVAGGEESTAWFDRHGSTPVTDIPDHWPADYQALVQRRIDLIASDRSINLVERPEFKRRWAGKSWDEMQREALTSFILDRLEAPGLWEDGMGPRIRSVASVAQQVKHDDEVMAALRTLTGVHDPDVAGELSRLMAEEAVPFLAAFRFKESGLVKRAEWERVWGLQRREDAGEQVDIPVPPKYGQADFRKTSYWRARGKLDVPKERFVSYPGAGRDGDPTVMVGWAGWDQAEQARALARLVRERIDQDAWGPDRLVPLVAGLVELEPWLHQWYSEIDPAYGLSQAAMISSLIDQYLNGWQMTRADLQAWRP